MLINGKDVEINYKKAAEIQSRVNLVQDLPDNVKTEVSKKDKKELDSLINSNLGDFESYGFTNNTLLTGKKQKENRKEYYDTFQEMSEYNFIHRGLQQISDDCSQRNVEGHTLKNYSDDDEIKEILNNLFFDRLNIDKELWSIIYETCKLGDNFYEVIPDSYEKPTMIARIRFLEADRVNRIEKNGKLAFYTYTADATSQDEATFSALSRTDPKTEEKVVYKLEPWQIIHFKINDKDFYPYGGSLLKAGVKCFRRLQLLEDGMVVYRLARVPERRVFKIDVGNLPQSEANRYVMKIKDNYRTSQILDDRGNINRTAAAISLCQDIFVPVRDGGKGTDITTLSPGMALQNIDDIRYFRDQILWTMNIPPEYLGTTSDGNGGSSGRGSLAMQDVKFSRFAERIQFYIVEGLTKLAAIELFFKKKKKEDLKNFRIELTPPSNIKELMDLEFLSQKMNLIQTMNATGMFPKKFILQYVMRMSKKEINNLIFFKDLEMQAANTQENALIGGIGMSGMGDTSMMGTGMANTSPTQTELPQQSQPQQSVNTEELTEKMINIFGKDVLIENKEEFAKIINAAEEFNKLNEAEKDTAESNIIKEMASSLSGVKEEIKTNNTAFNLIYENELGGIDFKKNTYSTFSKPKKKTGPRTGNDVLYEETTTKLQ